MVLKRQYQYRCIVYCILLRHCNFIKGMRASKTVGGISDVSVDLENIFNAPVYGSVSQCVYVCILTVSFCLKLCWNFES